MHYCYLFIHLCVTLQKKTLLAHCVEFPVIIKWNISVNYF